MNYFGPNAIGSGIAALAQQNAAAYTETSGQSETPMTSALMQAVRNTDHIGQLVAQITDRLMTALACPQPTTSKDGSMPTAPTAGGSPFEQTLHEHANRLGVIIGMLSDIQNRLRL